jgi:hypothetical protein
MGLDVTIVDREPEIYATSPVPEVKSGFILPSSIHPLRSRLAVIFDEDGFGYGDELQEDLAGLEVLVLVEMYDTLRRLRETNKVK